MNDSTWTRDQLARFTDLRERPFRELLARVGAEDPRRVVDAGMGGGHPGAALTKRWPAAAVEGFHESSDRVATMRRLGMSAYVEDLTTWSPDADVDVITCSKVMHWVPDHGEVMTRWAQALSAGAWLAIQMSSDYDAPAHVLIRELATQPQWRAQLEGVLPVAPVVREPGYYAQRLAGLGCVVDAWESTYTVSLPIGKELVLLWAAPTAMEPVFHALKGEGWKRFSAELEPRLKDAYPELVLPHEATVGAWLQFRRVFVVAQTPASQTQSP